MTASEPSRFLIKFRDGATPSALRISARFGMAGTTVAFASEPLFQSVGVTRRRGVAAGSGVWRLATASAKLDEATPGITATPFSRRTTASCSSSRTWSSSGPTTCAPPPTAISECGPEGLSRRTSATATPATKNDNYWFRNSKHGQFDAALTASGGSGQGVRIAHLDTGYDPDHKSIPKTSSRRSRSQFRRRGQADGRHRPIDGRLSTISVTAAERSASWPVRPFRV